MHTLTHTHTLGPAQGWGKSDRCFHVSWAVPGWPQIRDLLPAGALLSSLGFCSASMDQWGQRRSDDWRWLFVVLNLTFQLERGGGTVGRSQTLLDLVFFLARFASWEAAREVAWVGVGVGERLQSKWGGVQTSRAWVAVSASSAKGFGSSLFCVHADEKKTREREERRFILSSSIVPFHAQ